MKEMDQFLILDTSSIKHCQLWMNRGILMFFRQKGKLRKVTDQKLWNSLSELKAEWMNNKIIIEKSVEPSEELLNYLKISEAKYFYLVREAKIRHLKAGEVN